MTFSSRTGTALVGPTVRGWSARARAPAGHGEPGLGCGLAHQTETRSSGSRVVKSYVASMSMNGDTYSPLRSWSAPRP